MAEAPWRPQPGDIQGVGDGEDASFRRQEVGRHGWRLEIGAARGLEGRHSGQLLRHVEPIRGAVGAQGYGVDELTRPLAASADLPNALPPLEIDHLHAGEPRRQQVGAIAAHLDLPDDVHGLTGGPPQCRPLGHGRRTPRRVAHVGGFGQGSAVEGAPRQQAAGHQAQTASRVHTQHPVQWQGPGPYTQ